MRILHAMILLGSFLFASVAFASAVPDIDSTCAESQPLKPLLSREDQARLAALEKRLKQAQESGDAQAEAEIFNAIGVINYTTAQFDDAVDAFVGALTLYRRLGDQHAEALVLSEVGAAYAQMGMAREAIGFYKQSLPIWKVLDPKSQAVTLGKMAEAFRALGDADEAMRLDQQALSVFIESGDKLGEAAVLNNIGLAQFSAGNKKDSINFFFRAGAIYHDAGRSEQEATTLNNIAVAYSTSGDQKKALASFGQALELHHLDGNRAAQAPILENMGVIYSRLGLQKIARDFYDEALLIYREVGDQQGQAKTIQDLAQFDASRHHRKWKPLDSKDAEQAESRLSLAR